MTAARVIPISFVTVLFAAWTIHGLRAGPPVDQQVSKPAQTPAGPAAPKGATKTLTGTVLDSKGQRVKEGRVWLPVKSLNPWETLTASCNLNASDPFRLTFPEEWLPSDDTMRNPIVWAYASGHAIGTASASDQLFGAEPAKPFTIELPPAGDLSFVVLLPNGKPAVGARVEPEHFKTQRAYDFVPRALVDVVAAKTDAEGRAAMPALTRDGVHTIDVKMAGFGTQQFRCNMKSTDPPEQTLRLRDVGRLEGRIATDQLELARDVFVSVQTTPLDHLRAFRQATGIAMVKVDNQGRFAIPEIAGGRVQLMARCDERLPVRARLPESTITLLSGETTNINIPLERAVRVHGVVRAKDTQKPLAGVKVALRYNVGQQGDYALTNEKGEYSALGLAGEVYVHLISIPDGYEQLGEAWSERRTVPADAQDFTWPAIDVVPTIEVVGKLVDREGKPMPNVRINGVVGNRRYGFGNSDKNGAFTLSGVPQELRLERFEIWTRDEHLTGVVETKEPLVVRVKN
jgi:hypothetical protein